MLFLAVVAAVKLYIGTGGKDRKRLWLIITVGVILVILAVILVTQLQFVVSDEFDSAWAEWYKKEEKFRAAYGWGALSSI